MRKNGLKWIGRIYSAILLFVIGGLLCVNFIHGEYIVKIKFDLFCLTIFCVAFIIHFILLILTKDLFVKWVAGIMIIPSSIGSFFVLTDSGFSDWVGSVIGVAILIGYSLILFFFCRNKCRWIPIALGIISLWLVFLFSSIIFTSTYVGSQILQESTSPDGKISIRIVEDTYESDKYIRVVVHPNWSQSAGIFCLKRGEDYIDYTLTDESFEIDWINNDLVMVNGRMYTRISDFQLKLLSSFPPLP